MARSRQTGATKPIQTLGAFTRDQHSPPPPAKSQRTKASYQEERGLSTRPSDVPTSQNEIGDNILHNTSSSNKASESGSQDNPEDFTFAPSSKRTARKPTSKATNVLKPITRNAKVGKGRALVSTARNSKPCSSKNTTSKSTKNAAPKPAKDPLRNYKYSKGPNEDLRPIHEIEDIFEDMATRARGLGLSNVLKQLEGREIRVATMCSGTESPLLALELIFAAIKRLCGKTLYFKHLFSAEIVPYKQAYIERNFHPDYIFRDIRELAKELPKGQKMSTATTAYGAVVEVPVDVDILVAGFSCVDFSKLNSWTKSLSDVGESGDTFRAILNYAKKHRPAIIILENVCGAPWDFIKAIWENDHKFLREDAAGRQEAARRQDAASSQGDWSNVWEEDDKAYAAHFIKVDTRDYYIPQTRQRKYMICIDRSKSKAADEQVKFWENLMKAFERPASSSVQAFLLDPDDPRLDRARDELTKSGHDASGRKEVDWTVCQGRHQDYRNFLQVGFDRPITSWVDGGSCKPPDYWWKDWTLAQVERLWDMFDISYLRNVRRGYDSHYKARIWDLSQNVDRFTDGTRFGFAGCITPSGLPFLTTRGGPLVGLEALALQGLPIERLVLTRENQKELQDLAGNAMTSTVIGAALLSAIISGCLALICTSEGRTRVGPIKDPEVKEMSTRALQPSRQIDFAASKCLSVEDLRRMADNSICLCYCEGQTSRSRWHVQVCQECLHTTCENCGGNPSHVYETMSPSLTRINPRYFAVMIKQVLPMRLCVLGLSLDCLENFKAKIKGSLDDEDWRIFSNGIEQVLVTEFRFQKVVRSHCWKVHYDAHTCRLELAFIGKQVFWSLFAKAGCAEPGNSKVRQLLKYPLARMMVRDSNFLNGQWQLRIPAVSSFSVTISGKGMLTRAWQSRLGIESVQEAEKQVFPSLMISADESSTGSTKHEIAGEYKLLPNCGTAFGSLHRKISSAQHPLFLHLETDTIGNPKSDCFVFSARPLRVKYGEVPQFVACLDPSWRPSHNPQTTTVASVYGEWINCGATLQTLDQSDVATSAVLAENVTMPIDKGISGVSVAQHHCSSELIAALSCIVSRELTESKFWRRGPWSTVNRINEHEMFSSFAWLTERVRSLGGFKNIWRPLNLPGNFRRCTTCAPGHPKIEWEVKEKGQRTIYVPYEDGREAGNFERAMKNRPPAFTAHVRIDEHDRGCLMIGLNIPTLAHRALAKYHGLHSNLGASLHWRLITQYQWPSKCSLPKFGLCSNKEDKEANYVFNKAPGLVLRPEQKRSLQWMIDQESNDAPSFYEQEIEEATLPQLGWRAEVRVRRARAIKGGVLADEVGYGKTAIILALIDSQKRKAMALARTPRAGSIQLKATLIIVPRTLVPQWERQVKKFLGDKCKVFTISVITDLGQLSILELQKADIVIMAWSFLKGDAYLRRVSLMAALPEVPGKKGRALDAWLSLACQRIAEHTEELKANPVADFARSLKERYEAAPKDEKLVRSIPTKRLRGKNYLGPDDKSNAKTVKTVGKKDNGAKGNPKCEFRDFFRLQKVATMEDVTNLPLQMFSFARLVVDEYTYVDSTDYCLIESIKAESRWVLSGTPPLDDFADVKILAGFLGINLGIDDDAAGILKRQNINAIRKDKTPAEQFGAFSHHYSPAWHSNRQKHAQTFLHQFVRQNTAEIEALPYCETIRGILLPATERAINMELQQQLSAQNMSVCKGGKGRKDSDRVQRLNNLIKSSKTGEEAMLKRSSVLAIEGSSGQHINASEAGKIIILQRKKQYDDLCDELKTVLRNAVWLKEQVSTLDALGTGDVHFRNWKGDVNKNYLGDCEGTEKLVGLISRAEAEYDVSHEEQFYRDPPTKAMLDAWKAKYKRQKKKEKDARKEAAKAKRKALRKEKKDVKKRKEDAAEAAKSGNTPKPTIDIPEGSTDDEELYGAEDAMDDDGPEKFAQDADGQFNPLKNPDDDLYVPPADPRPNKFHPDDKAEMVRALRVIAGHLRSLSAELVARIRALRFFEAVQYLQLWQSGLESEIDVIPPPVCTGCQSTAKGPSEIFVLGVCGHFACKTCLAGGERAGKCVANRIVQKPFQGEQVEIEEFICGAPAQPHHLHSATDLGAKDSAASKYGSKLDAVIDLIKNKIPSPDQVLLFVQFDDLIVQVATALKAEKVTNFAITERSGAWAADMIEDFQENDGSITTMKKKKVLILNSSNSTAAGANLTNANHVIFISPPFTTTHAAYEASLKQSIGRALRYGQTKTVYIYKFLALKTIDVDIMEKRSGLRLVQEKDSTWVMKSAEDLTEEQRMVNWGSGFVKQGYLEVDDVDAVDGSDDENDEGEVGEL